MKEKTLILFTWMILAAVFLTAVGIPSVMAQTATPETPVPTDTPVPTQEPTQVPTLAPTNTPEPVQPTNTPEPTQEPITEATATPFARPLIVITSYNTGDDEVSPGDGFNLNLRLKNTGGSAAYNVVANFQSSEFAPMQSGGVKAVAELGAGNAVDLTQPLQAANGLWGYTSGSVAVALSYTDAAGTPYTENFTVTIPLAQPDYSQWAATATPTAQPRAQIVVAGYEIDVDPLQPGTIFNLKVQIRNMGSTAAKNVTMVLGGGVTADSSDGTTGGQQSGMSGGSADLSNFAPLGSSNLIFIESVPVGEVVESQAQLIVNVSSQPGAYPFKLSFVYDDEKGNRVVDNQVITLLVYSLPKVEVGFYRDPGVLMTGQPGQLPLQITNLGKSTAVMGNLQVTADNANVMDNVSLVGALEPGGYFTMDATVIPSTAGPLSLKISVSYTDDFNQPRTIEQSLTIQVDEMPVYEPEPGDYPEGGPGMGNGTVTFPMGEEQPETFGQKALRFFKGMIGLGSGKAQPAAIPMPMEEMPGGEPVIIGPKG